jgi:hypothetical protein
MARVDIPVRQIVPFADPFAQVGIDPDTNEIDADTGLNHQFDNNGRTFLQARNSDAGGAHNVTIITPHTVDGLAVADRVVSVPLSSTLWIGPFPKSIYSAAGDVVQVNPATTDLKFRAFRL